MKTVKIGMYKAQILDILGNPNHSRFAKGVHQWVYIYYVDEKKLSKKLTFKRDQLIRLTDYNLVGDFDENIRTSETLKEFRSSIEKKRKSNAAGFKNLDDEESSH